MSVGSREKKPGKSGRPKSQPRTLTPGKRSSDWDLRRVGGIQLLVCEKLGKLNWLAHGFSTRPRGVSEFEQLKRGASVSEKVLNLGFTEWDDEKRAEENRRKLITAAGAQAMRLITLQQIHSDIIHAIDAVPERPLKGDALITQTPGLLLGVQTADCIPILLVDPKHRAIAAIHSGWRGTVRRIAAKTVGRMQFMFGTDPSTVLAAIGPGIGRCSYEVGPDVVKEFASQFPQAGEWFDGPFDALASGEDPNPLPWLTMMPPGHMPPEPRAMLDLRSANHDILIEAGIKPENIAVSDFCTFCRGDLFFSYRREQNTGRMMAVIGIR